MNSTSNSHPRYEKFQKNGLWFETRFLRLNIERVWCGKGNAIFHLETEQYRVSI